MQLAIVIVLKKNSGRHIIWNVNFDDCLFIWVKMKQNWGRGECYFEIIEWFLLIGPPLEKYVFFNQCVQKSCMFRIFLMKRL